MLPVTSFLATCVLSIGLGVAAAPVVAATNTNSGPAPSTNRQGIPEKEAKNLAVAAKLLRAGALRMALQHLQANPPSVPLLNVWQAWAEQKWSILILLKDWETLKQDAKGLPASFGSARHFAIAYQARAMIALGEYDQARRLLQPALQTKNIPLRLQKDIRTQLIALYQAQGDYTNAKIEAIRFHDDYAPQDTAWFVRRAVIEYLAGDASGAAQLLAANASIEAKLLLVLFRKEAGEIDHAQALEQINKQLQRKQITQAERKLAYAMIVKINASPEPSSLIAKIRALEQYLVIDTDDRQPQVLAFTGRELRDAYLALAELLINRTLQDPTRSSLKFALAQKLQAQDTLQARALYADVMLADEDDMLSAAASNQFVSSLMEEDQFALLTTLFGEDKLFGGFQHIDSTISAQILNQALDRGEADVISLIAPYLGAAPEGVDPRDWILQKARIDIFAGRFEQGKDKIVKWLGQGKILSGEEVDRVLQPVFDLQAVQQDDISLALFDLIAKQTHSKRHRREILFWKAQSFGAKGERIKAAKYYLRSAMVEANGFDQWGHSARYHAASTLMEAGEYADARQLFEGLLAATTDATRRGTIKQALQRLWLLENQISQ